MYAVIYMAQSSYFTATEYFNYFYSTCHTVLLGRVALGPQRPIVVKLSRGRSVGRSVCRSIRRSVGLSVCPLHCGETADRIRQPFGIIGRTSPGMRQVVWLRDRSTGRGAFGGEFGARHCNQWWLYGVSVRQRRHAALFPNYFGQTCYINWPLTVTVID